jgi:hypothetical protein
MTSIESYFADLCARLPGETETVRFRDVRAFIEGWRRNDCHGNVKALIANHPEYRAVRGWAVSGAHGAYQLGAHSVVSDGEGTLWDITFPDLAEHGIRFLCHRGTEQEFCDARAHRELHFCFSLARLP